MKPIIFSPEMVRAILAGNKTQTRRVIKDAKPEYCFEGLDDCATMLKVRPDGEEYAVDVDGLWAIFSYDGYPEFPMVKSKYQPGDILWVRETWMPYQDAAYYKADDRHVELEKLGIRFKWRPSIHMPRTAARIFLRVTDVRVERVEDISEEDAIAEGCFAGMTVDGAETPALTAKQGFMWLWDSLNAERGFGWAGNPWVFVYEFGGIGKNETMQ